MQLLLAIMTATKTKLGSGITGFRWTINLGSRRWSNNLEHNGRRLIGLVMMTVKLSLMVLVFTLLLKHSSGFPQRQPRSTVWVPQFDDNGAEGGNEGLLISQTELPESVTDLYPKITKLQIISDINYRYAHTAVSSTMFNPDRASQELHFSMVIPETAFISGFSIEVNEEVYKAYVHQKELAKKEYEEAVQQGKTAGHVQLSARDSNRFMVSVNIEPLSYMSFNLTYEELLVRKLSTYSHIINLDPGQIVEDLSLEVNIQESSNITTLHVPPLHISNEISTHPEGISNPLAKVVYQTPERVRIKWAPTVLQQQEFSLNGVRGQLIVQYDTNRTSLPGQLLIHEDYFAHFFAPEDLLPLQKHVIFVLDVSFSMQGQKLMQLKEAMYKILDDLYNEDFFSLVTFSTNAYAWRHSSGESIKNVMEVTAEDKLMIPVTKYTIKKAKRVVSELKAHGGTNLYDAIKWALTISAKSKIVRKEINTFSENIPFETIVILITDGEPTVGVTNEETIISGTSFWNKECEAAVYSLAVGKGADFEFLKKLSLRNSGFARRIYEGTDTAIQLTDFYQQVASPFLANVSFIYDDVQVVPDTITRSHFSSFYSGSEIVVAGQLLMKDSRNNLHYEVIGESRDGMKHFEDDNSVIVLDETLKKQGTGLTEYIHFLERLWAYLNINQLLEHAETADEGQAQLKEHALELALKYSFVTPLTSLVVVRPNGSKALAGTQRADNEGYTYAKYDKPDITYYLDKSSHSLASSKREASRTVLQLLSSSTIVYAYYMNTF